MDKFLKYATIGLFAVMALLIVFYIMMAGDVSGRIHGKTAQVLAGVNAVLAQGGDVSAPLDLISQVKPLLAQGDIAGAEALLDKAIAALGPAGAVDLSTLKPQELPIYNQPEQQAALFAPPERVQIIGYYGNAMEPFLSPDGEFLFFNNESSPQYDTNIFYAKKKDDRGLVFEYIGPVPGLASPESDSAPSMDSNNRFFLTSQRSYNQSLLSLYAGNFTMEGVTGVRVAPGDLAAPRHGWINTDAEVGRDGNTLYFTRSSFLFGQAVPLTSDLVAAYFTPDGEYLPHPQNDVLMQQINTPALEYGPSLTADGLELYFTRASRTGAESAESAEVNTRHLKMQGRENAPQNTIAEGTYRIMVASRESTNHPFAGPYMISGVTGNVGGPYITNDGGALYFHRAEGKGFVIYRAMRRN